MISVVIPIYNQEKYLEKCLKSVQSQTFSDFEVILINDGSTDRSLVICEDFVNNDDRFKVFTTENEGVSNARNEGLKHITKELIMFIDSDDWIDKEMFHVLYANLIKYDADISCCGYYIDDLVHDKIINVWDNGSVVVWNKQQALFKLMENIEMKDFPWAKLYKSVLWNDVSYPKGAFYEDVSTTFKVFDKSKIVVKSNSAHYHYVQHNSNITSDVTKNIKKELDNYYAQLELYFFVAKNPNKFLSTSKIRGLIFRRIYRAYKQTIRRYSVFSNDFKKFKQNTDVSYKKIVSDIKLNEIGILRYFGVKFTLYAPYVFSFFYWIKGKKKRV